MTLIYQQWTKGGTGITNFSADQLPIYEAAVKQYGDRNLIVSDKPMPPMTTGGSLHCMNMSGTYDLSAFWKIFEALLAAAKMPTTIYDPHHAYDRAMKGIRP